MGTYSQVLPVFNLQWEAQLVFCFERARRAHICMYEVIQNASLSKKARLAFTAPRELSSAGGSAAAQGLQAEPRSLPFQPRKLLAW